MDDTERGEDSSRTLNSSYVTDDDLDDIPLFMEESEGNLQSGRPGAGLALGGALLSGDAAEQSEPPKTARGSLLRPTLALGARAAEPPAGMAMPRLAVPAVAAPNLMPAATPRGITARPPMGLALDAFRRPAIAAAAAAAAGTGASALDDTSATASPSSSRLHATGTLESRSSMESSLYEASGSDSEASDLNDADLSSPPRVRTAPAPLPKLNLSSVGPLAPAAAARGQEEQQPDSAPRSANDSDRRANSNSARKTPTAAAAAPHAKPGSRPLNLKLQLPLSAAGGGYSSARSDHAAEPATSRPAAAPGAADDAASGLRVNMLSSAFVLPLPARASAAGEASAASGSPLPSPDVASPTVQSVAQDCAARLGLAVTECELFAVLPLAAADARERLPKACSQVAVRIKNSSLSLSAIEGILGECERLKRALQGTPGERVFKMQQDLTRAEASAAQHSADARSWQQRSEALERENERLRGRLTELEVQNTQVYDKAYRHAYEQAYRQFYQRERHRANSEVYETVKRLQSELNGLKTYLDRQGIDPLAASRSALTPRPPEGA